MTFRSLSRIGFIFALAITAGCGGKGLFGCNYCPDGNIQIFDPSTGQQIVTSPSNRKTLGVGDTIFRISVLEKNFSGPYDVKIVGTHEFSTPANAGNGGQYPFFFNVPCFGPHQVVNSRSASVLVTFTEDNQIAGGEYDFPSPFDPTKAKGTPCHAGEQEDVAIDDFKGHTVYFYYEQI